MDKNDITSERLKMTLFYDPDTGVFVRTGFGGKVRNTRPDRIGRIAGYRNKNANGWDYIRIRLGRHTYEAHRLAWFYMNGRWPEKFVDHINGDGTDNRFCNLREATPMQNKWNSRPKRDTGLLKGVRRCRQRYQAKICVNYKDIYLGTFSSQQEAHDAYCLAASLHFGEFARFGIK